MTRVVTLQLDEFGQRAFERSTRRRNRSAATAVRTACLYYLADRDSGRTAWRAPKFAAEPQPAARLQVSLDDATWAALAEEAERQGVTAETLALHALVYFLADLESGRVAGLLEEALEDVR
jgi:predicted DNA-binding ribbon-helix-helix protein